MEYLPTPASPESMYLAELVRIQNEILAELRANRPAAPPKGQAELREPARDKPIYQGPVKPPQLQQRPPQR